MIPFRPNVHPKKGLTKLPTREAFIDEKYGNKWDYLHSESVQKAKTFKKDLAPDEAEYLKNQEMYTFHPNLVEARLTYSARGQGMRSISPVSKGKSP